MLPIKKILGVICLIIILVGIYLVVRPKPVVAPPKTVSTAPVVKKLTLGIKNNKLTTDTNKFTFTEGDTVEITATSDVDAEIHFHGYDKLITARKDQPVKLEFVLDTAGNFPFELEESGTELGTLIVNPK